MKPWLGLVVLHTALTILLQEISDDLSTALADLMTKKLPSDAEAVLQPSYVTYNFSTASTQVPSVTLLESRSLISSFGSTGFRTWEAGLRLGEYLVSDEGKNLVRGKRILELGSGTGLLAILCARWLGSTHINATDGDDRVVEALETNIFLNGLQQSANIDARSLKWGRALEEDEGGNQREVDVVIGADVVSQFLHQGTSRSQPCSTCPLFFGLSLNQLRL